MYCVHCGADGAKKFCAMCGKCQLDEPSGSLPDALPGADEAELEHGDLESGELEYGEATTSVVRPEPIRLSVEHAEMDEGLIESTPGALLDTESPPTIEVSAVVAIENEAKPMEASAGDWTTQLNYELLLSIPTARARIAASGRGASIGLTSQDLLAIFDAVAPVGISLGKLNTALMPIYDKLGIKTLRWAQDSFVAPPGRVLLALLCVMARESLVVTEVQQDEGLCQMAVDIPSSLVTNPGQLFVVLESQANGVVLELRTRIPGQLIDFGQSKRLIQTILEGVATDLQYQLSGSRTAILRVA